MLNRWFAALPPSQAQRLRRRLLSKNQNNVEGAFWELFLHEALRRSGFAVDLEVSPGTARTDIDFLVSHSETDHRVYVEATVAGDPAAVRARRSRMDAAWDEVNKAVPPGFFISVSIDQEGAQTPSGRRLREAIMPWLNGLDRDSVARSIEAGAASRDLPENVFAVDDWRFRVRALPMTDEGVASADDSTPLIGMGPFEVAAGGSRRAILNALDRKRPSRYGQLDWPYVVAILDTHRFADVEEVVSALFGEEAIEITLRGDEIVNQETVRRPNGFWREDRNRSVAAVVYARKLAPWSLATAEIQLIPNPWASRPATLELPWARTWSLRATGDLRPDDASQSLHELFDLPSDWPGPEAFFDRRESG